jgi:hypothetical protein
MDVFQFLQTMSDYEACASKVDMALDGALKILAMSLKMHGVDGSEVVGEESRYLFR